VTREMLNQLRSGQLAASKRLALNCGLTEFPPEIFEWAESLEILDLSNNHLKSLPDTLGQLTHLKAIFFANNEFEELPEVLTQCPQLSIIGFKANRIRRISDQALSPILRWLILTDNQLEYLPPTIANLSQLQKLMLAGNRLRSLPDEMAACQNLELIRLSANQLTSLPPWLFSLPRLSWLAYAGNLLCATSGEASLGKARSLPSIDWADLSLENTLGQGASGVISKGQWRVTPTQTQEVAVKVFKGEITSDGLPADEMQACITAGAHPNLVSVLGKLVNHPDHKAALLLSLIPPDYKNLGGPPNLDTCTRDTYPPDITFALAAILRIVRGIADAVAHLHRQGVMHGDLYAHNILVNHLGDSLLGDFGAACLYNPSDTSTAPALERLEVRAWGCLLEDLLDRCDPKDAIAQPDVINQLRHLQQDCMQPAPSLRPLFTTLCDRLARIETAH
jgi:Protein tyrosine and serine/threonine kinase/Leucine rich repeat